jgi:hypothetical protein
MAQLRQVVYDYYGYILPTSSPVSIDFHDENNNLIGKLDEIPDAYFTEGGKCLIIKVPFQTGSSSSHISKFHLYTTLIFNNI